MTSDTKTDTALADASTPVDVAPTNPVQLAFFEGLDLKVTNSALAARDDDLPRNILIRGFGTLQLHKNHSIGWDDVTGLNGNFVYCRQRNDFDTASLFFRRLCELNGNHVIELSIETRINEIMHAWWGTKFSWWRPAPGMPR